MKRLALGVYSRLSASSSATRMQSGCSCKMLPGQAGVTGPVTASWTAHGHPHRMRPHTGWQRLQLPTKSLSAFSYGHPHFFLIMGRAHWNSCTSRIAEKSQMEKRILGLLCAKKTKQRPLRRPRRFRGRCHCGSGNAAGISLQTDNAWPCADVPHFLP